MKRVLLTGMSGTGKSTLAKMLAEQANFQLIRSDVVRKEVAGSPTPEHQHDPVRLEERGLLDIERG